MRASTAQEDHSTLIIADSLSRSRGASSSRHSGAQAKPASPESIPTACGYGFRPSPLSRLGRNDQLKALAPSNTSSFPRRVFCARVLKLSLHSPRSKGGGAPRVVRVLARHPLGLHVTRQARRLTRRLASHDGGRPPPGAPPWRFWAPVPRFPHRQPGSRTSRGGGCESLPQDATPRSVL